MAETKVLVIQLRQLGDILLTTPCLRAIKQALPEARVTFLSHAMGRLILDDCPYIDEHFFYDNSWSKLRELRLARTLRARQFDMVFDFMYNPRSAFYALFSGSERRLAFHSARRFAYTDTVPRLSGIYVVEEKLSLLRKAGIPADDRRLILPWTEVDMHPVLQLHGTSEEFRDASLRVVLSPTHRREVRRWPLQKYAELADRLVRTRNAYVSWIHGPGEGEEIDAVMAMCKERTYKAPKTSFREMAAFVANMDLFVGNSNGPSHVAVANDTPSLQLHGPTDMHSWCPLNERHHGLQAPDRNMASIEVSGVEDQIDALWPAVSSTIETRKVRGPKVRWDR